MEITKNYIQNITKENILKYGNMNEFYEEVLDKILKNATHGLTHYLIYKDDFKEEYIYHLLLKLLQLDGYNITTFENFTDVGW